MKKILLHVGTLKTGSTTIQKTLFHNRGVLARYGIHYLSIGSCHAAVCWPFWDEPWKALAFRRRGLNKEQTIERNNRTLDFVQKEITDSKSDCVVISAEHFSDLTREHVFDAKRWLSNLGDVHVVYFTRQIESYIGSRSQLAAKKGSGKSPLGYKKALFHLIESPINWREAVGPDNFTFYRFEDAIQYGLTNTLLKSNGLPEIEDMGIEEGHFNQSMSNAAAECLFEFNKIASPLSPERNNQLHQLLKTLPGDKYRAPNLAKHQVEDYNNKMQHMHELCGVEPYPPLTYRGEDDGRQPFATEAVHQLVDAMNDSFNEVDRLKEELAQRKRGNTLHSVLKHAELKKRQLIERLKNFVRRHPPLMRFANLVRGR